MTTNSEEARRAPRLFRNFISFIGATLAVVSLISILFLFAVDLLAGHGNPYLGIFAYVVLPFFLILGLILIPIGMLRERVRRRKLSSSELAAFPKLDLNDPRDRRRVSAILISVLIFLVLSLIGSYQAYEYTDSVAFCGQVCHSVMKPEFTTYQASPHARVLCTDCHVGPGADWYFKSKLSGARQLYSVLFKKYPKPIPTPVDNMRPARETCGQCHWSEKFFGAQLKVFNRFGYDENNTPRQIRLLMNTGGGSPSTGLVAGIHWHMSIANEITYISTDSHRQVIPWVQLKDKDGNVTEYFAEDGRLSPEEIKKASKRSMDCIDCHNRPAHIFVSPDRAVNDAFVAGRLDASVPYLKQQAVEALTQPYQSTDEAVSAIASSLDEYYRANYPDVYASKGDSIRAAIAEIQRIFKTFFFPEMKVDWQTHPDNIGHFYSLGCFRCHDGQHKSKDGKLIRDDCNICHTVLDQTEAGAPVKVENGAFQHPIDMGDMTGMKCTDCHSGKGMNE